MAYRIAGAAAALVLATSGVQAAQITSQDMARPEGTRHFLVAKGAVKSAAKPPLIILLHGHGGTAAQLLGQKGSAAPLSVWLDIADREGLVLVAPDGLKGSDGKPGWNDCRSDADSNPSADDTAFVAALIDREVHEDNIDPARVFVMGMSNGGMMTFRVASELGKRVAGFAAVSASMAASPECAPPMTPVSALIISGTKDPLVPYEGGPVGFSARTSRGSVIGIEQAVGVWRRLDGLPEAAVSIVALPPQGNTTATRTVWGGKSGGFQVELLRIDGGGHVEPSKTQRIGATYAAIVGRQNGDVEAAEEAWAFFKDKRR